MPQAGATAMHPAVGSGLPCMRPPLRVAGRLETRKRSTCASRAARAWLAEWTRFGDLDDGAGNNIALTWVFAEDCGAVVSSIVEGWMRRSLSVAPPAR